MSLGETLTKMSLDDSGSVENQPTRPPTLGEVKKSLRVCEKIYCTSLTNQRPPVACQAVDSRGKSNG
jgi:hypothetical protein